MSYMEELLKKAIERGVITAYAINGSRYELNTGHSIINADKVGALQELKEMAPDLFEHGQDTPIEETSVEKPKVKRKYTPKTRR